MNAAPKPAEIINFADAAFPPSDLDFDGFYEDIEDEAKAAPVAKPVIAPKVQPVAVAEPEDKPQVAEVAPYGPLKEEMERIAKSKKAREEAKAARAAVAKAEADELCSDRAPVSLIEMAGDHPLATYAREWADSIQIPRDSTFMIGLGLTSAIVGAAYSVINRFGSSMPLGLYVVAEQPPGAGKSAVMKAFQESFIGKLQEMNKLRYQELKKLDAKIKAEKDPGLQEDLEERKRFMPMPIKGWVSDPTSEALEKDAISPNGGFFMSASDEQGILNSLFGLSYSGKSAPNLDAVLKGFDGGYFSSVRATREGFEGYVHGSIVCFAQPGSIDNIMSASNGTGAAERFLWLSEDHNLGKRDHLKPRIAPDRELFDNLCRSIIGKIGPQVLFDKLNRIALPAPLAHDMAVAMNVIEPELGDDGRFNSNAVRGAAGKHDIQVTKVAGVLHVTRYLMRGEAVPPNIGAEDFDIALKICRELLERYRLALVEKRFFGLGSETDAVVAYLEKFRDGKDMEQAKNSLRSNVPFRDMGKQKTKAINAAIDRLIAAGMVTIAGSATTLGRKKIVLA